MPDNETRWVLIARDGNCIVKGKSRKYLVGSDEPTRKEIVSYRTRNDAISALRRSYILCSSYVLDRYGEIGRREIEPVETVDF